MANEPTQSDRRGDGLIATNRKARRDYEILETFQCGMSLLGPEVKSLREKHVSIEEAFARTDGGILTIYGMHVRPYKFSRGDIDPDRPRILLVHKKEILEMAKATEEKGTTLVPLRLDFVRGMVKLTLGIGKGKRQYDKRQTIKKRDSDRDIARALKDRNK